MYINNFNHDKLLARGGLIVSSTRDWYEWLKDIRDNLIKNLIKADWIID